MLIGWLGAHYSNLGYNELSLNGWTQRRTLTTLSIPYLVLVS